MIIHFCMKHADVVDEAVDDEESCGSFENKIIDVEKLKEEIKEWFRYGEYLDLQYNTKTKELKINKPHNTKFVQNMY